MDKPAALKAFESLSSGVRLDIFCLLAEAGPGGLVAGQIAQAIGIPATNLSFHVKALLKAGMVTVESEGRFQRYRANVAHLLRVLADLTESCYRTSAGALPGGEVPGEEPAQGRSPRKAAAIDAAAR